MVRISLNSGRKTAIAGKLGALFSVFLLLATLFNLPATGEEMRGGGPDGGVKSVEILEDTVFESAHHTLNTSLIVRSGATLEVRNSTIMFEAGNGTPEFLVEHGATLKIENSVITANQTRYRFKIDGALVCENSTIRGTSASGTCGGIVLNTNEAIIRNSTVGDTAIGLYLPGMGNRTLLVDDDHNESAEKFYFATLTNAGIGFDYWCVEKHGIPLHLKNYSAVVWFTGSGAGGTLNTTTVSLLSDYLNASGRLLLTGQGIGRDINSTYLYGGQIGAIYGGHGNGREVYGQGFLANFSGWINARYPLAHGYVIAPPGNAVLRYADGECAGVGVKSGYMVFYTEFSVDCLDHDRATSLISTVFDWFGFFALAPQVTLYQQDFENFSGAGWSFEDGTGNGTWGLSDYRAIGGRSLWCAGNASKDAESIALYEDFEEFGGATDFLPFNGVDAFNLSDRRTADGNYSLWCAASGSQWEDSGICVAFEDFAEFRLKAMDENRGSGLDYWGAVDGRAWCAAAGDEMVIMNLRARRYDNQMNAVMYLPVSIPYDFATLAFRIELGVCAGDYLEVGYVAGPKHIAVKKYDNDLTGVEKVFISKFADAVYFRFVSDASNAGTGAWIDDIEVRAYNYTTYLDTDFTQGLGSWKSYDADGRGGIDTWGVVKRGESYDAWCAAVGSQSNLFDTVYSQIFSDNFDYGLVNWRNNGTKTWTLGERNLSKPFSAHTSISDNTSIFPATALLETEVDATETRSQKFEFDLIFTSNSDRTIFFVEVFAGQEWKRVYERTEESKRWQHCTFVTAEPFTVIRCGLVGNGEASIDNFVLSGTRSIPNTAVTRYDSFMDASLEHEVDLAMWEQPQIRYTLFYNLSERDQLSFEVYTDGWETVKNYSGTLTLGPLTECHPLPENARAVRFRLVSDRAGEASGVYLKNIRIYGIKGVLNIEAKRADRGMETKFVVPVNLTGYSTAFLSFLLWLDLSPSQNFTVYLVNASATVVLADYTAPGGEWKKWVSQKFDLTEFAGQAITLAFVFMAKHYGELSEGVYVDAIKVAGTTEKLCKSNMHAVARFNIQLECERPWVAFSYLAEFAAGSGFRTLVDGNQVFETRNSTDGWCHTILSLEEFAHSYAEIAFEFFSATEVSSGVYIDNIHIGGIRPYQDGGIVIENVEIWAQACGMVIEDRNLTVSNLEISAATGLQLRNANLTAFYLRVNSVEIDADLEDSTLYAYDDNLNPVALRCDQDSRVYSNRSLTAEIDQTKQGMLPAGTDVFGNPLLFVRKNTTAVASHWYFTKNGTKLQWYAPYTLITSKSLLKIFRPPVVLPVITAEDIDEDGLYNVNEYSKNIVWVDASTFQNTEKVTDSLATVYGVNWTFKQTNVNNGVTPKSAQPGFPIVYSTMKAGAFNVEPGTYRVMFRARATDPLTDRIVLTVDTGTTKEIHNTTLRMDYQWYETLAFVVGAKGINDLNITGYSTRLLRPTSNYTLFEKLAFVRISDEKGNPTDVHHRRLTSPLIRDCDDDALSDAVEFPNFVNSSAYIEAEWLGAFTHDSNASNGLALQLSEGTRAELEISRLNFTETSFAGLIRVRARGNGTLNLSLESGWSEGVNLTQDYRWYEFTTNLRAGASLVFTCTVPENQGIADPIILVDRINIFDLTALTRTRADEGQAIPFNGTTTFSLTIPLGAALSHLSFNISSGPEKRVFPAKNRVESVAVSGDSLFWIEKDATIAYIKAYSFATACEITIAERDPSARNISASEMLVAWEESISGISHVCIAFNKARAAVHTYQGRMPHVDNDTVVFLPLRASFQIVKVDNGNLVDVVWTLDEGCGAVSFLTWNLRTPKIYGNRMLVAANNLAYDVLLLIEFSEFVLNFTGKKFFATKIGEGIFTNFEIWGERIVYSDGYAVRSLELSTGENRCIHASPSIVDYKLSRDVLVVGEIDGADYRMTAIDTVSGRTKQVDIIGSPASNLGFSDGLLCVYSEASHEIYCYASSVSVDVGCDGTQEREQNSFFISGNTGNLISSAGILSYTFATTLTVRVNAGTNATISGIYAAFTTFTDPFLKDTDFDNLSDGVEMNSYFAEGVIHLEDALEFSFTERAANAYLQFGVQLSANRDGGAKIVHPFDALRSGPYLIRSTERERITSICGECEEPELPEDPSRFVKVAILDASGEPKETNTSLGFSPLWNNETAYIVKARIECTVNLSAGRYWLEISVVAGTNLTVVLDGALTISTKGMDCLDSDTDGDGLGDGFEFEHRASPVASDPDRDGLEDGFEISEGTSALERDTDLDGLRDTIEADATAPVNVRMRSSYWERMLFFGSPFCYGGLGPMLEIRSQTSPTNPDSDFDGLPDGFVDGWQYSSDETGKYMAANWRRSGPCDGIIQVWEFEDLNLNGVYEPYGWWGDWGFLPPSFEFYHYIDNGILHIFGETDATRADTDGDACVDGYEVLYATKEPYDRYWEPRKAYGMLYLLNPVDSGDGARDVDIYEEEVVEETRANVKYQPEPPNPKPPEFINYRIDETYTERAVLVNYSHMLEIKTVKFSASSNSSRIRVELYSGTLGAGTLLDSRVVQVNPAMGNVSVSYTQIYLMEGYLVFKKVYDTDTEAFIGGMRAFTDCTEEQETLFAYKKSGSWHSLAAGGVYNFSLESSVFDYSVMRVNDTMPAWAVLIENPEQRTISSLSVLLSPEDARTGNFVIEIREYTDDVSIANSTLVCKRKSVLNEMGWYRIDITDTVLPAFYVVLRYGGERFCWLTNIDYKPRHAVLITPEEREFRFDLNPCIKLYTYSGSGNLGNARHGDGVNNTIEGLTYTNPLSENTDAFCSGSILYTDELRDMDELESVVFRTNAFQGAMGAANYRHGTWIEFRAKAQNGVAVKRYMYAWLMSDVHYIDMHNSPLTSSDNFKLYSLTDGSCFYRSADGREIYLWVPGLPPEVNESYTGICHVFALDATTTPTLSTDWKPNPAYRDQELYISSPFDIDSDDDGFRDGVEIFWNLDVEPPNPYGITDMLADVWDIDSDNDGINDAFEVTPTNDCDTDGKPNMVDADSDSDGLIDGREDLWNLDTDNDGLQNMIDAESDGDGLVDGVEMNPYLAAENLRLTFDYAIYVDGQKVEPNKIFAIDFSGNNVYVGYYSDGNSKIAAGKFERYAKNQYLQTIQISIGSKFAVNASGAIITAVSGNLVAYTKTQTGSYAEKVVVKNLPAVVALAVNFTHALFVTPNPGGKVYAVNTGRENQELGDAAEISDLTWDAIAANENGCWLAGKERILMPDGTRVDTENTEKKGICALRDGSVVWAEATRVHIVQPPYSKFYPKLNVYQQLLDKSVKLLKSDARDNLFVLTDSEFFMLKFAKTDMLRADTDADGLWDGYNVAPYTGELPARNCEATVLQTSTPKYASYLENVKIPLPPYVRADVPFTDPTEKDSDGDGLDDAAETEGWNIQVRDCAIVVSGFLNPLETEVIPKSRPFCTFNAKGIPEIISPVEPVYTVGVNSNPLYTDTDCDGLSDGQEYQFTNPLDADTDNDGLTDGFEVGEDGILGEEETSPVARDTDGDGLPDGWLEVATDNTLANEWGFSAVAPLWKGKVNYGEGNWDVLFFSVGPNDGRWASGKEVGECVGVWKFEEGKYGMGCFVAITEPLEPDTDDDGVEDGTEFLYLLRLRGTPYWDSRFKRGENPWEYSAASSFQLDLRTYDSDSDGLSDGEENWVVVKDARTLRYLKNTLLDVDAVKRIHIETDPTDPDCDADGLLDGQEFEWRSNPDYNPNLLGCWDDINAWDSDVNDNANQNNGGLQTEEVYKGAIVTENNGTVKITVNKEIVAYSTVYVVLYYSTGADEEVQITTGAMTHAGKNIWITKPGDFREPVRATVRYYTPAINQIYGDYAETYCVFRTNARFDEGAKRLIYTSNSWVVVPLFSANGGNPLLTDNTRGNFTFSEVLSAMPDGARALEVFYGGASAPVLAPDGAKVYMLVIKDTQPARATYLYYYLYIEYVSGTTTKYLNFTRTGTTTDWATAHSKKEFWLNRQETLDWRACSNLDADFDGLSNQVEALLGTSPNDADTDDDGLSDGDEVQEHGTLPKQWDTDGDGLPDGLEVGVTSSVDGTAHFTADADPTTTTDPLNKDTDSDGIYDGGEDANHNGNVDLNSACEPIETSPLDADSDDDGLIDGAECTTGTKTFPLKPDSDGDGLPDGLEVGLSYGSVTLDTDLSSGNFIGDADEGTSWTKPNDADTDDDQINDGVEDRNRDGVVSENETDPNALDTDKDGLSDSEEDADRDGIVDNTETDPRCRDSDTDGLWDGTERGRIEQGGIPRNRPSTDPLCNDTDGDNLTDYAELKGWDYTVIWQKTKEKKGTWHTYSMPTKKDTDGDGMPDFDEFLNHSDPWLADTDGDRILDRYENATEQWQIEGRDPWINGSIVANVVTEIASQNYIPGLRVWLTVSFKAEDNAGLGTIRVTPQGLTTSTTNCNGALSYEYSHRWEVPILSWNTWVSGYDVYITIADINGNGCNATAHADGAAQGLVNLVLTAIQSFVEEVKSLVSEAINWIWEQINGLMNGALAPIYEGIDLFVKGNYRELAVLFVKKGGHLLAYGTDPKEAMEAYIKK
ncbi:MAG: hypothetical protein N3F63_03510 [Thermoplasmata archaeon]|nr:hypothetical protein [Thermoplasmata archaeon]